MVAGVDERRMQWLLRSRGRSWGMSSHPSHTASTEQARPVPGRIANDPSTTQVSHPCQRQQLINGKRVGNNSDRWIHYTYVCFAEIPSS